eukprot:scaffold1325_cov95-Cylindrotheca_fusiformis.AAC.4
MMMAFLLLSWFSLLLCLQCITSNASGDVNYHDHGHHDHHHRDRVTFNHGWKFRTGLKEWADPYETPPTDVDPGIAPPESLIDYDTSNWRHVSLPHDGLIASAPSKMACPNGCSGQSFLPRHVLWYRKKFSLPSDWEESRGHVWLEFDGSFRNTTVWLDGKLVLSSHDSGYTPFSISLDDDIHHHQNHTIAVFVDPDNGDAGGPGRGSGWWYEGGGLYRNVWLNRAPRRNRIDDLFVYTTDILLESPTKALWATLHGNVTLYQDDDNENDDDDTDDDDDDEHDVCIVISISDQDGQLLNNTEVVKLENTASPTGQQQYHSSYQMKLIFPQIWSTGRPFLYQVHAVLRDCETGRAMDSFSVYHGIRTIDYTANHGFFLNQQPFKIRGFCDHDAFGIVVPDRINLFRAQASRSIGGNGRRTSHNPPDPTLLDIYDRLGMGKEHEEAGPAFQTVVETLDGTRPTLANMMKYGGILSDTVDVQGFSHRPRETLDECHAALPEKPIMQSECCSCNTMRGEDAGCETTYDNPHYDCDQATFNARCLEQTVNASDGVEYAAGTFVWTLFDYYGEPPSRGLTVSSTYGQFDLVGFPKPAAFWFRSQWLLNVTDGSPDKTFDTHGSYEVQLVESWESPDSWNRTKGNTTRTIHAYSNAPFIELFVNNASQGILPVTTMVHDDSGSYAEFENVTWQAGTLRAVGRRSNGTTSSSSSSHQEMEDDDDDADDNDVLAIAEIKTSGPAVAIQLSLDCPSPQTGTGKALFLDGQDAALVRASIVDETGQVVYMANDHNVTFQIVSGPGIIQGTGSGNPKSYEANDASWHLTYHGLVRAVVRVTSLAGLSSYEKKLLSMIDHYDDDDDSVEDVFHDTDNIVIQASSPGLDSVTLEIPTSINRKHSVLEVARASAGQAVNFFSNDSDHDDNRIAANTAIS